MPRTIPILMLLALLRLPEAFGAPGAPGATEAQAARSRSAAADEVPLMPDPATTLNEEILAMLRSYPTDGTHGYWWPRGREWEGTTRDLHWDGERIARGEPEQRCYCSGVTFEVYVRVLQADPARAAAARRRLPDAEAMRRFRVLWYGARKQRETVHRALTEFGLGVPVPRIEDARPGDFLQLWRRNGSGHCVVFLDTVHDDDGEMIGIRYWSTQKSTDGIGERIERFPPHGSVLRDELYIVRALDPRGATGESPVTSPRP